MLTTLANRLLADTTVSYKFFNNKLTIIVDTDAAHDLFGEVNITLANCAASNIYTDNATLVQNVFNDTFLFEAKSDTRLEHSFACVRGFDQKDVEVEITNNGSAITATVDNLSITFEKGKYSFKELDVASKDYDGALINLQEKTITAIGATNYNGEVDLYAETADETYDNIDNQELSFDFSFELSTSGETLDTNIPLLILKKD